VDDARIVSRALAGRCGSAHHRGVRPHRQVQIRQFLDGVMCNRMSGFATKLCAPQLRARSSSTHKDRNMDFKSSPLGGLYASLRQAASPKEGQDLDQCELRADSKNEPDLRVKTGDRSGWSSKARKAHQTNAMVIVGRTFSASMEKLLRESKDLAVPTQQAIRNAGTVHWNTYIGKKGCVTLGDVRDLHARAVRIFNDNLPATPAKSSSPTHVTVRPSPTLPVASTSSSGAAHSLHWTVVSPASSAGPSAASASSLASSLSSSATSSSSAAGAPRWATPTASSFASASAASASPGQSPGLHSTEALVALKAQYPAEKFLSAHGENDAATPANKQSAFHAKLDTLLKIAERHLPRLVNLQAKQGGFKTLLNAAAAMKVNPGMHPAAALYLQLHGPEAGTIYKAYPKEVDAHISQLTQMSPSEMAEMRKQAGKSK